MGRKWLACASMREPFAFLTTSILSLLVPLSFLLVARFSSENYLLSFGSADVLPGDENESGRVSWIFTFLNSTNSFLVRALVSVLGVATLYHGITGNNIFLDEPKGLWFRPRLYAAWILLCTLQVSVGLGVECSLDVGRYKIALGKEVDLFSRVIFFLGLHEAMVHWSRSVVKPVVDDTVFGSLREEKVIQKLALAACCGWLWWWRLRDEVESLVIVAEIKQELGVGVGVADFVAWWIYYLTAVIGMVRLMRSLIWVMMTLCGRTARRSSDLEPSQPDTDDKV